MVLFSHREPHELQVKVISDQELIILLCDGDPSDQKNLSQYVLNYSGWSFYEIMVVLEDVDGQLEAKLMADRGQRAITHILLKERYQQVIKGLVGQGRRRVHGLLKWALRSLS